MRVGWFTILAGCGVLAMKTEVENMKIIWLGHASFRIEIADQVLLGCEPNLSY